MYRQLLLACDQIIRCKLDMTILSPDVDMFTFNLLLMSSFHDIETCNVYTGAKNRYEFKNYEF